MDLENEEVFEEIDELSEKEQLEAIIDDATARLEELSGEEMEAVEGGATCEGKITRNLRATAYSYFYRVMLTNCPGRVINFIPGINVKSYKRSGNTYWVYRRNLGQCRFTVVSKKGGYTYENNFTVRFV